MLIIKIFYLFYLTFFLFEYPFLLIKQAIKLKYILSKFIF
jgi:hypothetical protein